MARMRMVTRTVNVTIVDAMCVTVSTAEVCTKQLRLTGIFDTDSDALKAVKTAFETDDFKPVTITARTTEEVLYGMPEDKFIQIADVLPPRKQYSNAEEA